MFLGHFEPVVTRFGPWKIPKCLEKGPFWDQKRVNTGSKTCFSKNDPRPLGMLKQVFWHVHALPCTALHCPAPPCTTLQDSCTTINHSICRPLGGTMMAHGRAYSAT